MRGGGPGSDASAEPWWLWVLKGLVAGVVLGLITKFTEGLSWATAARVAVGFAVIWIPVVYVATRWDERREAAD